MIFIDRDSFQTVWLNEVGTSGIWTDQMGGEYQVELNNLVNYAVKK